MKRISWVRLKREMVERWGGGEEGFRGEHGKGKS